MEFFNSYFEDFDNADLAIVDPHPINVLHKSNLANLNEQQIEELKKPLKNYEHENEQFIYLKINKNSVPDINRT